MKYGFLFFASLFFAAIGHGEEKKAKVVFISGEPSHAPGAHEHRAGNMLLAKRLNESNLAVEAIVLPENGYPKDPTVLEDAATVVIFCSGHKEHLLNPHLEEFDALMKNGTGLVMIHWATEALTGMPGKKFTEWVGGYCDLNWSVNPHWKPNFKNFPNHPISSGLEPFSVDDEWYYHMRFVEDLKGVTPVLTDVPPPETLKRPDGPRSGNPDVRLAVKNGESQHVGWAYQRPDGKGRGFGFTGGHFHASWKNDMFRKVILNAILWTAHVEVPEAGVPSQTPTDAELKLNLDDKSDWKKPSPKPKKSKENESTGKVPNEDKQHQVKLQKFDASQPLVVLVEAINSSESPETKKALISGMILAFEGQRNIKPPENWQAVSAKLVNSDDSKLKELAQQLSQIFGDESATLQAITTLKDKTAGLDERRSALASLLITEELRCGNPECDSNHFTE